MKRTILFLSTLLLLLAATLPAHAHESGQFVYRVGIGMVAPDDSNLSVDGAKLKVDDGTNVTLNGTYFFTRRLAFDVLASFPFGHDIKLTANGMDTKVAETKHLPPTFSLQFHFAPDAGFQPYVGVGVNWTTFFNTDTISALASQGVDLELDDSVGLATQVGADILVGDDWVMNLDLRYIEIETDARLGGADIGTVTIDPLVISLNFGYRF